MTKRIAAGLGMGGVLLGVAGAGLPLERYLEFPPRTIYVDCPVPWWPLIVAYTLFFALWIFPFAHAFWQATPVSSCAAPAGTFPRWGYGALLWTALCWALAWTRLPILADLQIHTFTPLLARLYRHDQCAYPMA